MVRFAVRVDVTCLRADDVTEKKKKSEKRKEKMAIMKESGIASVCLGAAEKHARNKLCFVNVQQITSEIEKKARWKVLRAVCVAVVVALVCLLKLLVVVRRVLLLFVVVVVVTLVVPVVICPLPFLPSLSFPLLASFPSLPPHSLIYFFLLPPLYSHSLQTKLEGK